MSAEFRESERTDSAAPARALPPLPPGVRSRVALGLTAAAAQGHFELQVCRACGTVQYPPREACHRCLGLQLDWTIQSGKGELLSDTVLHHSNDPYFRERLPCRVGLVKLDRDGPIVLTHLEGDVDSAPSRVRVRALLDKAGLAALVSCSDTDHAKSASTSRVPTGRVVREMTCDPKLRRVLVSDGQSAVGQALVRALAGAGANTIWAGHARPWDETMGAHDVRQLKSVHAVPLDVTDGESVARVAAQIGAQVDIVVNTAELHRAQGIAAHGESDGPRAEMEVNYFGLLRLAQALGPVMRSRAAQEESGPVAWVNLLSIYALSNFPPHGTYSASKAAACSVAQCLRAQMQPSGIRVINVFPGPLDNAPNRDLPPPKLTPEALAKAVIEALRHSVEDVYPGDVAQEWLARWRANPKVFERELATR